MSIAGNANYLKKIFRHPCKVEDFTVIVETAFPVAALAIATVFGIGCTDIVKMSIGKSPFHSRKMNALLRSNTLMEKFGPRTFLATIGYGAIERALWWWMIVDAASGIIPNWMSLIYQESGCALPSSGFIETSLALGFSGVGPPRNVPPGSLESIGCAHFNGTGVTIASGCYAAVTYQCQVAEFHPEIFGAVTSRIWLEDDQGNRSGVCNQGGTDNRSDNKVAGGWERTVAFVGSNRTVRVMFEVFSGVGGISTGSIKVSAYGRPMNPLTAGCTPKLVTYPWSPPPPPPPPVFGSKTPIGTPITLPSRVAAPRNAKQKPPRAMKAPKPARRRKPRIVTP
jgi:hypothetical protein